MDFFEKLSHPVTHPRYRETSLRSLEPVLTDLIQSKPVQRLRYVHQNGCFFMLNPNWNTSRFDHSIGVMLLLRRSGANLEEQIAGLLHDISHFAFSHVIDVVFDDKEEEFGESFTKEVIFESEVSEILRKHGYSDIEKFAHHEAFTLLEQPKGELCADRIDYSLRDGIMVGLISPEQAEFILSHLKVLNGRFYIDDVNIAKDFFNLFIGLSGYYNGGKQVVAYHLLAECIRIGMKEELVTMEDLKGIDKNLLKKLESFENDRVQKLLDFLTNGFALKEGHDGDVSYDVWRKFRYVDPAILQDGKLVKLSVVDGEVADLINEYEEKLKGQHAYTVIKEA